MTAFKSVLLKLSGEALMGNDAFGINPTTIESMVSEIAKVVQLGVQLAIVIGGGNIFRGVAGGAAGVTFEISWMNVLRFQISHVEEYKVPTWHSCYFKYGAFT